VIVKINGTSQLSVIDGVIKPTTNNDVDLGTSSVQYKDAFFDGTVTTDVLTVDETATVATSLTVGGGATILTDAQIADDGNFTADIDGDITLDANGGEITLSDNNSETGKVIVDMDNTNIKHQYDASNYLTTTLASTGSVTKATAGAGTTDSDYTLDVDGELVLDAADAAGVIMKINGTSQLSVVDGVIKPTTNNDIDLGTSGNQFKNVFINGNLETDALSLNGTTVSSSAAELNYSDISTLGTSEASKVVTANSSGNIIFPDNDLLYFGSHSDWSMTYDESGNDDLVMTGSDFSIESSTSEKPIVSILNTNADANGASLKLNKNGSSPATNDVVGNIDFISEDADNNVTTFGRIQSTIVDVTAGGEEGGLGIYVAENDGTLTKGMEIKGLSSNGNITVDISTHDGSAGGLMLASTLVTATAAELNIVDGGTSATGTTIADADRVVFNDDGTMKQVAVTDLAAYFDDEITAMPNLVTTAATTVGVLNSGSITSGFGSIDNGSSAITTTGTVTYGTLNDGTTSLTATAAEINAASDIDTRVENVTSTNSITAAESGKTFFLNSGTEFVSTLPAPAAGLEYTFIVKAAPSSASYEIKTNGDADILIGLVTCATADDLGANDDNADVITFVDGQAAIGDWVQVVSDGTSWYFSGASKVAEGITTGTS